MPIVIKKLCYNLQPEWLQTPWFHWALVDQECLNLDKTCALVLVARAECGNIAEQMHHLPANNISYSARLVVISSPKLLTETSYQMGTYWIIYCASCLPSLC
jgi:hypothetical protein